MQTQIELRSSNGLRDITGSAIVTLKIDATVTKTHIITGKKIFKKPVNFSGVLTVDHRTLTLFQ